MIALALLLAADCAVPAPADAPDPGSASVYAEVGEGERAAGRDDSARVAFQQALRLDGANALATRGLDALCASDRFEEGRRLLDRGDARGAAGLFARLRAAAPSRPAALLEGIARYQLDDDGAARPFLEDAARDPVLADAARFYLGLIALRADQPHAAADALDQVSPEAPFAAAAGELSRMARRSGKLVLSVLAESGYDSNVTLLPSGAAQGADAAGSLALAAVARPFGESGPWLRASGLYRGQLQLHDYDLGAAGGAAGWQFGRSDRRAVVEYDYDFLTLGAAPYLSAHRLSAEAAAVFGQFLLSAAYALRLESYLTPVTSNFSGALQTANLMLGLRVGGGFLRAGYQVGRDFAQLDSTSFVEHGPRAVLDLPLGRRTRLSVDASAAFRRYDGYDAGLGVQRADVLLDGTAAADFDLSDLLTLRASLIGRKAISNAPDLSYDRVAAMLGVLLAAGFF